MSVDKNIFIGTLPKSIGPLQISESEDGSLDSITQDYLTAWPLWKGSLASIAISRKGVFPGYSKMFVQDFEVEQEDDARAIVRVRASGLLDHLETKKVRTISSQGRVVFIGPIGEEDDYEKIATPSGIGERWSINEPNLTVTDSYFATTKPAENLQGTNLLPVPLVTAPADQWAGYSEPLRFNHPNGWVLDQRQITELVTAQLWQVSDFFVFYQNAMPA